MAMVTGLTVNPAKLPTMAKVFYVVFGLECRRYAAAPNHNGLTNFGAYTMGEAQRFVGVADAINEIRSRLVGRVEIRRVEEITTVGTKRRIEVPLGDKRQTGVVIKANQPVTCYANLQRKVDGGWMWNSSADAIENAQVFPSVHDLLRAVAQLSRKHVGVESNVGGSIVGIAEESTPGTTKYTETVLA